MISFLKGNIISVEENIVVLDVGGVGYELNCSSATASKLSNREKDALIYTYLQVREDAMLLFGFEDKQEKSMFLKLITVPSVGPKLAITILSGITPDSLAISVLNGDIKTLSSIKGVGKKTAEKIIVELREKVGRIEDINSAKIVVQSPGLSKNIEDAASALTALGISKTEALKLTSRIATPEMTPEEIIKKTLKDMGK